MRLVLGNSIRASTASRTGLLETPIHSVPKPCAIPLTALISAMAPLAEGAVELLLLLVLARLEQLEGLEGLSVAMCAGGKATEFRVSGLRFCV